MKVKFYLFRKAGYLLLCCLLLCAMKTHAQVYANTQTNGVTGLCLLCNVSTPDNPVNNSSLDDYSAFNVPAGLLGISIYQTLIFPAASSTGCDSLVVGIGTGDALLSLNILAGVTI
ncbi:hypothetical protein [Chitinophaga nivalis]|uniref:Uncharacterized protein n=1 Tax=Chitinophaga nivalis TaxID=2991709 RepID=A0ABT3IM88_9BACT|nr:hypothetical protein [Chitinophaga nivalis]MCW3465255.1 hypothetical protein [Chitinophaga nivalis]MCW3485053.1 hypothetical protein [Chitinophaga nivalis]